MGTSGNSSTYSESTEETFTYNRMEYFCHLKKISCRRLFRFLEGYNGELRVGVRCLARQQSSMPPSVMSFCRFFVLSFISNLKIIRNSILRSCSWLGPRRKRSDKNMSARRSKFKSTRKWFDWTHNSAVCNTSPFATLSVLSAQACNLHQHRLRLLVGY